MHAPSIVLGLALNAALVYLLGETWTARSLIVTGLVVVGACGGLDLAVHGGAWLAGRLAGKRAARAVRVLYEGATLAVIAAAVGFVVTRPSFLTKTSTATWLLATLALVAVDVGRGGAVGRWWARRVPQRLPGVAAGVALMMLPLGAWVALHGLAHPRPANASDYCGRTGDRVPVVVFGLDGATWRLLRPLVDDGELPNLGRLVSRGASGVLEADVSAVNPFANSATLGMRSPTLWETIATGFPPRQHGVWDFEGSIVPWTREVVPFDLPVFHSVLLNRSNGRLTRFFELAAACGRKVAAVGWYNTWPAVPLDGGALVSDLAHVELHHANLDPPRIAVASGAPSSQESHVSDVVAAAVSSPALVPGCRLRELAADERIESGPEGDVMARLISTLAKELRAMPDPARRRDLETSLLTPLRHSYLRDRFYHRAALCLASGGYDLFTVVYRLPDETQHLFWRFWEEPRRGEEPASLGKVIPAAYRLVDAYLGELLALLPANARVLVVSDHGFGGWQVHGISTWFPRNAMPEYSGQHCADGILVAAGGGAVSGPIAGNRRQESVAPTVAWLLGLAAPLGSSGVPLVDIFDGRVQERLGPVRWAPWPPAATVTGHAVPRQTEAVRGQLRALGYVE